MLAHITAIEMALALFVVSLSTSVGAVNCAVCSPTIFFRGLTRTLTLSRQEGGNTVQCNYDSPSIPGFSPGCLYRNVDGQVTFTNTGATLTSLPGACPNPLTLVSKTSC